MLGYRSLSPLDKADERYPALVKLLSVWPLGEFQNGFEPVDSNVFPSL